MPLRQFVSVLFLFWTLLFATAGLAADHRPMLPMVDNGTVDVAGWWVSEKLDGVRAYWDGARLWSKNGKRLAPPPEFVAGWPPFALEGELWGGRGTFALAAAVAKSGPREPGWQQLRLAIFDVPAAPGGFEQRIREAQDWFRARPSPSAFVVEQHLLIDRKQLQEELQQVTAQGGEGLMVRDPQALYQPGRSERLLKVKAYQDAEATVIGHLPGQGQYAGQLGALLVERPDGVQFRLGIGFSAAERAQPPAVGTQITYKYYGLYPSGLPRFPAFLRVRGDRDW